MTEASDTSIVRYDQIIRAWPSRPGTSARAAMRTQSAPWMSTSDSPLINAHEKVITSAPMFAAASHVRVGTLRVRARFEANVNATHATTLPIETSTPSVGLEP